MNHRQSVIHTPEGLLWIVRVRDKLKDWLISPSKHVIEPGERIRAELIATSTFFFALLTFAGTVAASSALTGSNTLAMVLMKGFSLVTFLGYLLSRTRYYSFSGLIIMSIWTVGSLGYVYSGRTTDGPAFAVLNLVPFGFILGFVLLRTRALLAVVLINVISVLLLPTIQPEVSGRVFNAASGVLFAMGGLTLIAQRHRDQIERERLRVISESNRELSLIGNVRDAMARELELPDLLRSVVEAVSKSFGYTLVSLYIVDGDVLVLQHQVGYANAISRIPLTKGVMSRVVRTKTPILLEDVRGDPEFLGAIEGIVSEICVPLKDEGQVVGVLNVESTQGIKLTKTELKILTVLSEHVGVAIGRARLYALGQQELIERKRAQEEREMLINELSIRNTEMERFTYTVSHDLKAPLVTINGFLSFLEKDAKAGDVERLMKDTARIHEAVDKMHNLLTDLLELSRIGRLMNAPETTPFNVLITDALDNVYGQLEERGVTVQIQPNMPPVYGDRQRLAEVFQNLLENAAKYMGNQPDPHIEVGQRVDTDDLPIFFVKDNGIGIAPEHHERIFDLFNKLDPKTEGTGIGLATVKRIVEVHGGRIWVESEEGKGSTFYFALQNAPSS